MAHGSLYIISAPSGTGKTSLTHALIRSVPNIKFSVSYTTRPMRAGERDGIDYHFVSVKQFETMIAQQEFIEHAKVFGNYYGTAKKVVETELSKGWDIILEIDWQGAQQVQKLLLEMVSIFIVPPSQQALRERIMNRKRDELPEIEKRLKIAAEEITHYDEYDYLIVNDQFETALGQLQAIVRAERCKIPYQIQQLHSLLADLMRE